MPVKDSKIDILQSVSFFAQSPQEVLEEISARLQLVKFKTGETIFEKGDPSDSMYILVSGRLGVYDGKSFLTAMEEREFNG